MTAPKTTEFYTHSGLLIAVGYRRLVVGKRGAYVEFDETQITHEHIRVPEDQAYRLTGDWPDKVFYFEYRTIDECNVMVYHQKRYVGYADYIPGLYYISPDELKWNDLELSED